MRVLLHTYNTCFQNPSGGVQVRVKKIKDLLENKNIVVDFFNPSDTKLRDYDILHVYKLDAETAALITNAKRNKLKIIISPIIGLNKSIMIDAYMKVINRFPISTTYKQLAQIIKDTDMFFAETPKEKVFICKHYGADSQRVKVLPNGVDPIAESEPRFDVFEKINGKKKYILSVGRINQNKNILNLIKAIGPTGINLVVIGGPDKLNGEEYYEKCITESKKYTNVYMLGWVDNNSDLLVSAYQNADTVVLPSYQETFGLVLLEGGINGAKVAYSKTLPINDYALFRTCPTFDPHSIDNMRRVIQETYKSPKSEEFRKKLVTEFSWESIIDRQISYYKDCLHEKNTD